ncbi:MAG TPA: hypothetical protein VEQ85_01570, partial [Lacipirellulaceae bacterium]|nr:hypothetical protein [Lacipirellulaceae bacterium]
AVLGAKRPQDRAWQWVVLSLWIVLLVPAGQALDAQGRGEFTTALPWSGLLRGLIARGPVNYLATRCAVAHVACAFGQYALLAAPLGSSWTPPPVAAVGALLLAAVLPTLPRRAGGPAPDEGPLGAFTGRWLAFRDGWGAFWALRVLNRVNETAALSRWPVRLQWTGFTPVGPGGASLPLEPSVAAHLEQTLDTLLRRFESVRRAGRDERG